VQCFQDCVMCMLPVRKIVINKCKIPCLYLLHYYLGSPLLLAGVYFVLLAKSVFLHVKDK